MPERDLSISASNPSHIRRISAAFCGAIVWSGAWGRSSKRSAGPAGSAAVEFHQNRIVNIFIKVSIDSPQIEPQAVCG